MAVAVQEHIDACGVFDNIRISPWRIVGLHAQVTRHVDVVRTLGTGIIHRPLHGCVERLAVVILQEIIHGFACLILEIGRRGLGDGPRSRYTDKGDLPIIHFKDGIRLEDRFPLMPEIAADVRKLRFLCQRQELVHPVVKLMIPGNSYVVLHGVHEVCDRLSLAHGAQRLPLDRVSHIHQDRLVVLRLQCISHLLQASISEPLVDPAVHITGKENIDILRCLRVLDRLLVGLRAGG